MPSINRRLALTAAVVLMGASALAACSKSGGGVVADDMSLGNPQAKVTVIEYASPSCPHCAAWNADVWPAFKAKYVDTGKVNYVFREFITPPPQLAAAGIWTSSASQSPGGWLPPAHTSFEQPPLLQAASSLQALSKAVPSNLA